MATAEQPRKRTRFRPRRIGPRLSGITMTPEEFDAIPETRWVEGYRYELIRGVLVVTPPPREAERDPNEELGYMLRLHQDTHPQGSALDKTLSEHTMIGTPNRRRADRVLWTGLGRVPDPEVDPPSIAVEFVSEDRRDVLRDYEEKRDEYLAAGVREYWVIDRFQRTMTVFKPGPDGFVAQIVREDQIYQTELLPGFELPLARLLAKADQWPRKRRRRPPARGAE
jgi:Uma2 family endonuclease